jgi:hypothetical protein
MAPHSFGLYLANGSAIWRVLRGVRFEQGEIAFTARKTGRRRAATGATTSVMAHCQQVIIPTLSFFRARQVPGTSDCHINSDGFSYTLV